MKQEKIQELLETYGLESILADFGLSVWEVLEILDELGYLVLDKYEENM